MASFKYLDEAGTKLLVEKIKNLINEAVAENAASDAIISAEVNKLNLKSIVDVAYVKGEKSKIPYIIFKNLSNQVVAQLDASEFIKDGMVDSVEVKDGKLVIIFNTESGKENIELNLLEIFNAENYYTKDETNEEFVKWGNYQGRKTIELRKRDTIVSEGVQIAMVSDYSGLNFPVVELGGQTGALVLNSNEQPVKVEVTENSKRQQYEVVTTKNGVTWMDSDMNDDKKFILLENADMVMGKINPDYKDITTDQSYVSLIQVNKWNCVDFGNYHLPLIFSVPEGQRPIVQAKNAKNKNEVIAYVSDLENLVTPIEESFINNLFE